ncbi:MAG: AAA family ATPase [bacterium]
MDVKAAQKKLNRLKSTISNVLLGKPEAVKLTLTGLIADGHVLIEDVPGLGKTMLVRSLARAINGRYRRIQFTPDLLPGDVTGTHIYNQASGEFKFEAGPAFTEILLADEINRATPRTQSSLLESMEERQITADGETYKLPDLFFVAATQNPVEQQGTFPLPEAQLDRFLLKFSIGYPPGEIEKDIAEIDRSSHPLFDVNPVCTPEDILVIQDFVKNVKIDSSVLDYIVRLVRKTRDYDAVELGASPRGSMALRRAAQAYAFLEGRDFVSPDDIQKLLSPTLRHRIIIDPRERMKGTTITNLLNNILEEVFVPVEYEPSG